METLKVLVLKEGIKKQMGFGNSLRAFKKIISL
jgi:hypothetical protein